MGGEIIHFPQVGNRGIPLLVSNQAVATACEVVDFDDFRRERARRILAAIRLRLEARRRLNRGPGDAA